MRELERKWDRPAGEATASLGVAGLELRAITGLAQTMVSGNLAAAARRAGVDAEGVGALGLAAGERYSVRLARDRLLIVGGQEDHFTDGWHEDGFAASGMGAALSVFELSGPLALAIVKRATTLFHVGESPCAATHFAGVNAYVYRHGGQDTVRLHIDRGLVPYLHDWLQAQSASMPPDR